MSDYLVYVCRAANDDIIYVGMTGSWHSRVARHRQDTYWWHWVESVEFYPCGDKSEASELELCAITAYAPRFNSKRNPDVFERKSRRVSA